MNRDNPASQPSDHRLDRTEVQDDVGLSASVNLSLPATAVSDPAAPALRGYVLTTRIGAGSYGEVWHAWQVRTRKEVAVKVFLRRSGLDWMFLRREVERLARLDTHPNVVRLLDADLEGEPAYYTMDLIRGGTLRDIVIAPRRPTTRQVIDWMHDIALAMAFVHGKGLIHCDLKPGNILIDEQRHLRITDFGQSRVFNESAASLGTLFYMAPEQALPVSRSGEVHPDVLWDIYGLGATIHAVITGHAPFETADNVRRIEAATTLDARLDEYRSIVSAQSLDHPDNTPLRGPAFELYAIVRKCLAWHPAERYTTVNELLADLDALAERRPVSALANNRTYRARKFLGRNWFAVTAATVTISALVAGLAVSMSMYVRAEEARQEALVEQARAEREAATAKAATAFLSGIFEVADPDEARGETITAREILDRGADSIENDMKDQPLTQATLLSTVGNVYRNLGLYEPAQRTLERALELRETHLGPDDILTAMSISELANVFSVRGDYERAENLIRDALARFERLEGPDSLNAAAAIVRLAQILLHRGELADVESLLRQALDIQQRRGADQTLESASTRVNLATFLSDNGRFEEAEPLFVDGLAAQRKTLGHRHPQVAVTLNNFARMYEKQRRFDRAEPLLRESLAVAAETLGVDHPNYATSLQNLANMLVGTGRFEEAEPLFRQAIDVQRRTLGERNATLATSLHNLARLHERRGDLNSAETIYRQALQVYREALGPDHPFVATSLYTLARVLNERDQAEQAETLFAESLVIRRQKLPPGHRSIGSSLAGHASALLKLDRPAEAETELREGIGILKSAVPPNDWQLLEATSLLGEVLTRLDRFDEAEPLLLDAHAGLLQTSGAPPRASRDAALRVYEMYLASHRPEDAERWKQQHLDSNP